MIGRPLNQEEIESYRHLGSDLALQVRVVQVAMIPGGYAGLTLRNLVLLSQKVSSDGDSNLLAHELVHVRQWHEQGRIRFLWRYSWSFASQFAKTRSWGASYRNIPAETEARRVAAQWADQRRKRPNIR